MIVLYLSIAVNPNRDQHPAHVWVLPLSNVVTQGVVQPLPGPVAAGWPAPSCGKPGLIGRQWVPGWTTAQVWKPEKPRDFRGPAPWSSWASILAVSGLRTGW